MKGRLRLNKLFERISGKRKMKNLKPEEVRQILDKDREGEFALVDVRQPDEYLAGHIEGAISIPIEELATRHRELKKNRSLIIYSRSGDGSMKAATLLLELGFRRIHAMDGGILNWNYKVIRASPEEEPDLIRGMKSKGAILMRALKMEKGSFDFYTQAVAMTTHKERFEILRKLAQMEESHMEKIANLLGWGADIGPWSSIYDVVKQLISSKNMESGVSIESALLEMQKKGFRDDSEVFEIALENEYLALDFYKRAAGLTDDSDTRILLNELAKEERHHIDTLSGALKRIVEGAI